MEIVCAKCRKPFVKAVRRRGGLDRLLSLAYSYPFRCQVCQHRFRLMQWGLRYVEKDVDRRQYERRPVGISALIRLHEQHHQGTIVDLAMGGCAIDMVTPLQRGTLLGVQMDAFDTEPPIVVETAIVRSSGGMRHNVEFLRIAEDEKHRLSQYILTLWLEGTVRARKGVRSEVTG